MPMLEYKIAIVIEGERFEVPGLEKIVGNNLIPRDQVDVSNIERDYELTHRKGPNGKWISTYSRKIRKSKRFIVLKVKSQIVLRENFSDVCEYKNSLTSSSL